MKDRYPELDSLRGIAALSVVLFHLGFRYLWPWVAWLPLRFLWAGHQAVLLFFVLSGFVLSLPFHGPRAQRSYTIYMTRRIARIWLPYVVIVLLVFVWRWTSQENSVPIFSKYRHLWEAPLTAQLLFTHLGLIVGMNDKGLLPTAWSLVHEMRISLIFPFLMTGVLRLSWRPVLAFAFLSSLVAGLASQYFPDTAADVYMPLSHTIYFMGIFLVGSLLAKHRLELISQAEKLSTTRKVLLSFVAWFLYTYGVNETSKGALLFLGDWAATLGAGAILIIALSYGRALFSHAVPVFLGQISYSLYLVHLPIICLIPFIYVRVWPDASVYFLFPIMFIAALTGGTLFWYVIERPVVAWCRVISQRRLPEKTRE